MNTELKPYEIDLIVQALEYFAAQGSGMGDLEIEEIQSLSNKMAALEAVQ